MNEIEIAAYISHHFRGVESAQNFGYTFFFYGADHRLPFATLATTDNEHDRFSNLDRPGVFRLNIGVSRQTFQSLFGDMKVDRREYDFSSIDTTMPHPDYAAQSWVCVLNPAKSLATVHTLIAEAYDLAVRRETRRGLSPRP